METLTRERALCPACVRSVPLTRHGDLARHHVLRVGSMVQRVGSVCCHSGRHPDVAPDLPWGESVAAPVPYSDN